MLWSMEMLQNVLEMYKDNRILWDNRHPDYANKVARDEALQMIASSFDIPNLTAADVMRKLRTMRAAYRVEIRNINAAKVSGFFYNPTLKWFNAYKSCMDEIDAIKQQYREPVESGDDDDISLEEEENAPNTYFLKIKQKNSSNKVQESHAQMVISNDQNEPQTQMLMDSSSLKEADEDVFSDDSEDDEFQLFADHIGEQLRTMSVIKAVIIQQQIKKIFAKDRKTNGLPQLAVSIRKGN